MQDTKQSWEEEFKRRTDKDNYLPTDELWGDLPHNTDTLLYETEYPESEYELDWQKVKDFIQEKITEAEKRKDEEWIKKIKSLKKLRIWPNAENGTWNHGWNQCVDTIRYDIDDLLNHSDV